MSAGRPKRLPGFRFETVAPVLPDTLPRMDIAVFVGFAASGPLDIPVAVESEAQFTAIFGEDAPLAWAINRGEQVYAHLPPAVRSFFRNGGQRCWVIRVARRKARSINRSNRAVCNYFPIPSLACVQFDKENKITRVAPSFAKARSEGSWSDSIKAGSALLTLPAQVNGKVLLIDGEYVVHLNHDSSGPIAPGELLRLNFKEGPSLYLTVANVELSEVGSPPLDDSESRLIKLTGTRAVWVTSPSLPAPGTKIKANIFTHEDKISDAIDPSRAFKAEYKAIVQPGNAPADKKLTVKIVDCSVVDAPAPGSVVEIESGGDRLLMTVAELSFSSDAQATPLVSGFPIRVETTPLLIPVSTPSCERLSFELWVRKGEEYAISLSDLGFDNLHARYWASLPGDEEIYGSVDNDEKESPATLLWRQVGDLFRFPLAGVRNESEMHLPLAMPATPDNYLGPIRMQGNELERDGLAEFDQDLFLDAGLSRSITETLSGEAEFLSYLSPSPRRLTGIHAAFSLEEATLIAAPDAVHPGWTKRQPPKLQAPEESAPLLRPAWWHFLDCAEAEVTRPPALSECDAKATGATEATSIKKVPAPDWGQFLECAIRVIDPPVLTTSNKLSPDGTFTLSWNSSTQSVDAYVLEESGSPDFSDREEIYSGQLTKYTIYGRKDGDYYYRLRAFSCPETSDWSNGVAVRVGAEGRWALLGENEYSPSALLSVQRALLRLCAARGDLFCVLSLPQPYREDKAIEHIRTLKSSQVVQGSVPPLGPGESNAFSYGAVVHPWLITRDQTGSNGLRTSPPCGAMIGLMAKRALRRGAWLAPANEPMLDVLALAPDLPGNRRLDLQEAHINLVRHEPRGFLVLDSDTLSDDIDLRSINVRRLLILLRRQALRLGATYVFEPNNDAFRRVVERGFTEMLDGMFERGAFAGTTAATSYQVVTDASLNTAESVEQGRFIVELRVAPSLPLSFVTIRLIQTSDRSLAMEVR